MRGNNIIERLYATYLPAPFLSILIDDCIAKGTGLPRRRRPLQHELHPGRRPRHDHGRPGRDQVPRLRPARPSPWRSCWPRSTADFEGDEELRPALPQQDAQVRQRRRLRRRPDAVGLRSLLRGRRRPAQHARAAATASTCCRPPSTSTSARSSGATPDGRKAGRAAVRGHLARPGRRPQRPDGGHQVRRQDGPHAAPAARCSTRSSRPSSSPTTTASTTSATWSASYFRLDGHHIQFNVVDGRDPARGPEAPGGVPRPDRPRRRLQRLLRRLLGRAPGRDHRPDRASLTG